MIQTVSYIYHKKQTMKPTLPFLLLALLLSSCPQKTKLAGGYELVWSDEFDKPGPPDSKKWNYDVGGHGFGNNELQFYT